MMRELNSKYELQYLSKYYLTLSEWFCLLTIILANLEIGFQCGREPTANDKLFYLWKDYGQLGVGRLF